MQPGAARAFGLRDKIGYALGDLGNDFTFVLASSFFMIFCTNVLGINAAVVGTIMLAVRLIDAFVDVAIGRLVDASRITSAGRFRPWIARMAVPVAVALVLMFIPGAEAFSEAGKIAYVAGVYLLWSVLYSAVNIPYGSMAAVISPDPTHRSSLSVFRTGGGTIANLVLMVAVPLFIYAKDASGQTQIVGPAFLSVAIVCAVLAVLSYVGCYTQSVERVQLPTKPKAERAGMGATLLSLLKNRAMVAIVVAALLLLVASMLGQAITSYLWAIYFNNGALQSVAALAGVIPMLLMMPFATKLARRFGKREIALVGVGVTALLYIILSFLPMHESPVAFIIVTAFGGFGFGVFNLLVWAFITDVIDYQEITAGQRDDGVVYSVYSWARKVGQAVAAGLGGWALGWVGYQAGTTVQSESTVNGIYQLYTLVPGVLYALVVVVLFLWYPLSRKTVEHNAQLLLERHQAAVASTE